MIKMLFVECCVCESPNFTKLYTIKRPEGTVNIVRCNKCGHIYQNPRLAVKKITDSYNKRKNFYRSIPKKANSAAFNLINNCRLKSIEKFLDMERGRILDIGCSFGAFIKTAKNTGWQAYGIEISKHMADFTKRKMQLNVFHGTLEEAKYPKGFFDVITMFDVLEHVPNPRKTIKECNKILKNNGLLVIQTPAIDSLYSKIRGKKWDYYGLQHLNYFSKKTMNTLLGKNNFIIKKIYYGDEIGFLTSIRSHLLNKENKKTTIPKFIITQLIRRIHIGDISFGSKVYYAIKIK